MTGWIWVVLGYLLAAAVWVAYAVWSGRETSETGSTRRDR